MTTAGVYGTIVSVDDDDAELEIAPGVVIRVVKAAIGKVIQPEPAPDDAPRPRALPERSFGPIPSRQP